MHARAPPCYMHTLPCNTQVRTFLEHAGLQHGEAALKEVRGFTGKLFENEEDYETPTVSVFFKDGGPYATRTFWTTTSPWGRCVRSNTSRSRRSTF